MEARNIGSQERNHAQRRKSNHTKTQQDFYMACQACLRPQKRRNSHCLSSFFESRVTGYINIYNQYFLIPKKPLGIITKIPMIHEPAYCQPNEPIRTGIQDINPRDGLSEKKHRSHQPIISYQSGEILMAFVDLCHSFSPGQEEP